jgi:hypothetical protein
MLSFPRNQCLFAPRDNQNVSEYALLSRFLIASPPEPVPRAPPVTRPPASVLILCTLFASACGSSAQPLPNDLRATLAGTFQFNQGQFKKMEQGEPVAKLLTGDSPDDLQLIGVVLIKQRPEEFIRTYKDIAHFEIAKEIRHTGKFSDPPKESDLDGFHVPDLNQKDLLACVPGDCAYKLPAAVMQDLKTNIDWSSPDAPHQADLRVRELWIQYLNQYRLNGDRALAVYYDTPNPFPVAAGLGQLIGDATVVKAKAPSLIRYLQEYPNFKPPDTEEFFYWQEAVFGLKPVVRVSHVIIQKLPQPDGDHYIVASKMLFASHYFRAAIEFKYLYPVTTPSGQPAFYFVTYQRSFVDGMTGFTGAILRRIVPGRSQASLIENLQLAKQRLERY